MNKELSYFELEINHHKTQVDEVSSAYFLSIGTQSVLKSLLKTWYQETLLRNWIHQ